MEQKLGRQPPSDPALPAGGVIRVVEAALFISSSPLDLNELGKVTGINSMGVLKEVVEKLQDEYRERGIEIVKTARGFQMQVKPQLLQRVAHLTPHMDLSEGCRRALALVVYKEPVKQSDIIKIQGNKAYTYIKILQKKGLIKAEKRGHTSLLYLTSQFEEYFGGEKERIREVMKAQLANFPFSSPERQKTLKEVGEPQTSATLVAGSSVKVPAQEPAKPEPEKAGKTEIIFERGIKYRKKEGIEEEGELVF